MKEPMPFIEKVVRTLEERVSGLNNRVLQLELSARQSRGVVNLDNPKKNCKRCGYDHEFKTEANCYRYCNL